MPGWLQIVSVLGAVVGGGAGITALFMIPSQLRKFRGEAAQTKAEAAETLSNASIALMQPAVAEAARLNKALNEANRRVGELSVALFNAQAEAQELRGKIDSMSKDLIAKEAELDLYRRGQGT